MLLEHLIDFEPDVVDMAALQSVQDASEAEILAAQLTTTEWLERVGAPNLTDTQRAVAKIDAQNAFKAMTAPEESKVAKDVTSRLLTMKTPAAVRHLVGMLTAYDWEFVEQAKELRGYAVAKIVEETKNKDPRVRLRALDMLGKVTEIALFTERIEVKRTEISDHELDEKIKEKLARFTGVIDVESNEVSDAVEVPRQNDA